MLHLSFQVLMLVPVVAGQRQKLSALAMACDRYRTSDRAEAAVASAVLQDTRCNNISGFIQRIDKTKSDENESESGSSGKQAKNNELSWGFSLTGVKTKLKSLEKRESIFFDDVSQRNIYQRTRLGVPLVMLHPKVAQLSA